MSSNIRVVKVCGFCKNEFIARKTTSVCCSDTCSKRFSKLKKTNKKIMQVEIETAINRNPKGFITEDQIKTINAKRYLTLKEVVILLNFTPLTLRRWVLAGKINSQKIGKKWIFDAKEQCNNEILYDAKYRINSIPEYFFGRYALGEKEK